jgi:hypothetical protein
MQVNVRNLHVDSAKALMAAKIAAGQHELTVVHRTHDAVLWERFVLVAVVISELYARNLSLLHKRRRG